MKLRVEYPHRINKHGRDEYLHDRKWRTISGWAREHGSDHKTMKNRIERGLPMAMRNNVYYMTWGRFEGSWRTMGFLSSVYGRSECYFTARRVRVDGCWTLDLSEETERARREESARKRYLTTCANKETGTADDDDRVIAKDCGDKALASFASLRFGHENTERSGSRVSANS